MSNNRRKILKIIGLSAGVSFCPNVALSSQKLQLFSWEGYALGADTEIQLYAQKKSDAEGAIKQVHELISKLEGIFSLYDPDSEIVALNNSGELRRASPEMIDLLQISKSISTQTKGAFDITVQPLWALYDRFRIDKDETAFERDLKEVIPLVGSDKIKIADRRISYAHENMAISFNGIAQGYITDKACALLKECGFVHTLVDVGEYCAAGPQGDGEPWRIGLLSPFDQISVSEVMELKEGGLATSGGYGTVFDDDGEKHHLFNPATGLSTQLYASVTVKAQDAATADALSTAFSSMGENDIKEYVEKRNNLHTLLTMKNGNRIAYGRL